MALSNNIPILVCDDNAHTRRLVTDVLRSVGFNLVETCRSGDELLTLTKEMRPRIVITSSRVPGISGLEYTRLIRRGYHSIPRNTSIIIMTNTPTTAFLEASQSSGVDEMLVRPFAAAALLARVEAVIKRPRRFIESFNYVGPCRRRRMLEEYGGPLRRFSDPLADETEQPWEAECNRDLVRACVTRISEIAKGLTPNDRAKLREIYGAVRDTEQLADDICDQALGDAARSFSRYISGIGASGGLDMEVVSTHIDALQTLAVLGSSAMVEREQLVRGLVAVVDKRLKAKSAHASRATA
ncbi:MAG: response regulator [Hyphomonadaceae bacterium]|nr:response regulator [Hyphomonadaceae bacterium]